MTLRQSHFVPPVSYLLAAELGFLRDVEVVPTRTPSSAEQLRALLAGQQDMVVTAIDNLFEWTRAGADLRLVAQVEQTTPLGIHARGDVEALTDLAGCRFAVDAPDNGFALIAKRLLRDAGIEVDYVVVGGVRERMDALLGGQVDATLLGPPFDKLAEKAGFARVVNVNALLPELPGQGLAVRAELLRSPELEGYLRALVRGVEAGESMAEAQGIELLERCGYQSAAASAWSARARRLAVDHHGLELLTKIRRSLGTLPPGISLEELCDAEPLLRATRSATIGN
ncbi:ABC transporter substrate-binding protein [Arthrobacter sp. BE255]|uniref:ABC transporter substrate-binding protein n=1 Tax=Arthrobacter sp. BE255 TaxID=2817721 RepID=UPI002866346E|nr:ABC transporter substrate-binding protein [Arthrobacter sp. BE255]MDR7159756.1 ABC-type nitrate/sulfonate/bicarbonate transport system substrate-binding protein [Arthrobacter sp. BE255]